MTQLPGVKFSVMKALLSILLMTMRFSIYGQGTVLFANIDGPAVNAPVYEADGVTALAGPQFKVELFGGPSAASLSLIATVGFLTGSGAGYFSGGSQVVPSVIPGNWAWIQVNVWNSANGVTFADAQGSGLPNSWWESSIFSVVAGGETVNPTPPAPLTGLGTSPVFLNGVPEPSSFALATAAAILILLRHTNFRLSHFIKP